MVYDKSTVCVSIVTRIKCMHTIYSNEPAMLLLENLVFLLFEDFCDETFIKKILRHTTEKLEGHFVLKQKHLNLINKGKLKYIFFEV